jgi:hypothetical protein
MRLGLGEYCACAGTPALVHRRQFVLLPYFLTDQTGNPRIALDYGDDPTLCGLTCNLKYEFDPDRLLEIVAALDRHRERTWPSNHAILVIEIEIVDIHDRIG